VRGRRTRRRPGRQGERQSVADAARGCTGRRGFSDRESYSVAIESRSKQPDYPAGLGSILRFSELGFDFAFFGNPLVCYPISVSLWVPIPHIGFDLQFYPALGSFSHFRVKWLIQQIKSKGTPR
jgi:hypothetical protein